MRRLLPPPVGHIDPAEVYDVARHPWPRRPWVMANMIASVDGAAAVDGRSGGLGGPADREVFQLLRRCADVVVAGAATVRTERYRPIVSSPPVPIAVVSRSLDFDWSMPLFTEATARTVILTCEAADRDRRDHAARFADVVVAGDHDVEPAAALAALHERGHEVALCEGGPTLLAQWAAAAVLDELCITVSPLLVGPASLSTLAGTALAAPLTLELATVVEDDGFLMLRYLVRH